MAIAFDNSAQGSEAAGTSLTFAHTVAGSNRLLWVFIFTSDLTTGDKISGVTYNGVAMTRVAGATNVDFVVGQSFYTYYLIAPATGANNVIVSATETCEIYASAQSYTGALQTGVPDGSAITTSGGAISITTVADNCWLAGGGRNIGSGDLTAGANTIERQAVGPGLLSAGDSNGAKSPAGSHSMNWTPDNLNTKLVMVSFAPAPEELGGAVPSNFMTLGVGV